MLHSETSVAYPSSIDPKRRQWKYNPEHGIIRSVFNGRCLSIDRCRTGRIDFVILDDCHIGDPKALCQGKNQQWTSNIIHQTIVSRMDGSCFEVYNSIGPNVDTYPCNMGWPMHFQMTDIAFPADHPALVRDLWAHKDPGIFTGHFTSPSIASHAVMMLNISLTK